MQTVTIDLDAPPETRWHGARDRDAGPILQAFYEKHAPRGFRWLATLSDLERTEIAAYAAALGVSPDVVFFFNVAPDLCPVLFGQTSAVANRPYSEHSYTCLYPRELAPLLMDVVFTRTSCPAFHCAARTFRGLIGIATAAIVFRGSSAPAACLSAPQKTFSVSVNARRERNAPGVPRRLLDCLFNAPPRPLSLVVRDAMQLNQADAMARFMAVELYPCFLVVAAGENTCVFVKGRQTIRRYMCGFRAGGGILVQTNHDIGSPAGADGQNSRERLVQKTAELCLSKKVVPRADSPGRFEVTILHEHATIK